MAGAAFCKLPYPCFDAEWDLRGKRGQLLATSNQMRNMLRSCVLQAAVCNQMLHLQLWFCLCSTALP